MPEIVFHRVCQLLLSMSFVACMAGCGDGDEGQTPDEGQAIIELLDPAELLLVAERGASASAPFRFRNAGTAALEFEVLVDAEIEWLEHSPTSGRVEPGMRGELELRGSCPETAQTLATLVKIRSNAAGAPFTDVIVRLVCADVLPGDLEIEVKGLPSSVEAEISVVGPQGYDVLVRRTTTLAHIPTGTYILTAAPVEAGLATYAAELNEISVEVIDGGVAQVTIDYELVLGSLEVVIMGLPEDTLAEVNVTAAPDFAVTLTESTVLEGLTPKLYTISPADVVVGPTIYAALSRDIPVQSEPPGLVEVDYQFVPGQLAVVIEGLPQDTSANVTLTFPDGSQDVIVGDRTFDGLVPGEYTLEPADVVEDDVTYISDALTTTVSSDETQEVTITYR